MIEDLKRELFSMASETRREKSLRYFKTGVGDYGFGDIFIGVSSPDLRKGISPFIDKLDLKQVTDLLRSKEHEFRLAALIILVKKFQKNRGLRQEIVNIYIEHTDFVNNWDLVDTSAHTILGHWLQDKDRSVLYQFANSGNIWKQRIAIISTLHFIKKNRELNDTFKISKLLLNNKEDLIHKAVGWMLREVGNISILKEEEFLRMNYKNMPRTMLRYAIEKFPEDKRQDYLKGRII